MTHRDLILAKMRKWAAQLPYLPRALALVWAAARRWTVAWAGLLCLQGVLPVAQVYLVKAVIDRVVSASGPEGARRELPAVLVLVTLTAGLVLLSEVLRSVGNWVRAGQSEHVQNYINDLVHRQSVSVDLAFYDAPDYFDKLHRARYDSTHRPVALLEGLGGLLQNLITLAGMLVVLASLGLWLPAALLTGALPGLYVAVRHALLQHHWRRSITADERRSWYYLWLMTNSEAAAELRLFDLGGRFRAAFRGLRERLRRERLALAKRQVFGEVAAAALSILIITAALAWVVRQTLVGGVTLGGLVLFYQALWQCQRTMRASLESVGQIYTNSLFLNDLFEFLALKPSVGEPERLAPAPPQLEEAITFNRVTFSYPGSGRPALRDFDLKIEAGRFVAIVGLNGAGKSTLIKLLCRLYDPDAGSVEFDGTDLREMSVRELRRMISVLFQEPVHYSSTVAENIGVGSLNGADPPAVRDAAEAAGADVCVRRLPKGYENLLGKWFEGGAELSVGEWQRVGLARAFLRRSPVIVLDEPTSAMDPWSEADWLTRFRRLAAGHTAVIITHRFTTAMHADVIHVMADGRIVESGSHDELVSSGGLYSQSWLRQARLEAEIAS